MVVNYNIYYLNILIIIYICQQKNVKNIKKQLDEKIND